MSPFSSDPRTLVAELKRRRIFRVAAIYAVVAWLLIQVAAVVFPALRLPSWTVTLVVALLLLGFPVALVLAWAFELTPEGVRRTEPPPRAAGGGVGGAAAGGRRRAAGYVGVGILVALAGFGLASREQLPIGGGGTGERVRPLERSIAVLPFDNLTGGEESEYFADGMTEDILMQLALVEDLAVISRTSVMRFKGSDATIPEIAQALGVAFVVEGSVRRAGDRVRIVANLIDARTDEHLWAETFDRDLRDIFSVQSEVALRIAGALQAKLSTAEKGRIERRPTGSVAAYDLYLRARELAGRSPEKNEAAVELARQAIALDTTFAEAYALLSGTYMHRAYTFGRGMEWADSGLVQARRAIALAPESAYGHHALGTNLSTLGRRAEAVDAFHRALDLNPNYYKAMNALALEEIGRGRRAEALRWLHRAHRIAPTAEIPVINIAFVYMGLADTASTRRWAEKAVAMGDSMRRRAGELVLAGARLQQGAREEALERIDAIVARNPDSRPLLLFTAGITAYEARAYEAARAYLERLHAIAPQVFPEVGIIYADLLKRAGEREQADALLADLAERLRAPVLKGRSYLGRELRLALLHAARGEREAALEWLKRAAEQGATDARLLGTYGMLDPLREDERFRAVMRRVEDNRVAALARAAEYAAGSTRR